MCKCFARCEADCVCDHDWTPPELTAARETIAALEAERDRCIDANIDLLHERDQLLNEIQLITAPHDSVGAVIAGIRAERDRLMAELAKCKRVADAARAVIKNSAYQGICDEDVELEHAVAALSADGEAK